ncbi:uncharacterized protein LOC141714183 [Apium graveolens]|uniref:uncharacterized protein LOC141714183 n=1 Tax=Apium graveolens TaxID=4045 RepID=UPI003D79820F
MFNRVQEPVRNNIDPKLQKTLNSPFKKFQSEVLPPKSAKSIPLTHHKLLSPIKCGGFHPSKNAMHIMEAAARIIESGSQDVTKSKMPPVGSSHPLKVRDLKERAEAAKRPSKLAETSQKPAESTAAKNIKKQSTNKSWNRSIDTKTFIASPDLEEGSVGSRNKGKSVSFAVQAKANNNQKQNCQDEREKVGSKSLPSNSQGKKVMSGDSSLERQRSSSKNSGNNKVGSRKIGREVTDDGKELPYFSTSVTRKKRCINGDFNLQKDQAVVDNAKKGKTIQFNGVMDSGTNGVRSSSVGCNVIEGDALSALLEQKLRELTLGVESSRHKAGEAGSTASSFQDQKPQKTVVKSTKLHVEGSKGGSQIDSLDEQQSPVFSLTSYEEGRISKHKLQNGINMKDDEVE